jgi:hypothetical protein
MVLITKGSTAITNATAKEFVSTQMVRSMREVSLTTRELAEENSNFPMEVCTLDNLSMIKLMEMVR